MAKNGKQTKTYCYVAVMEHYHFPPNEADMVAATPLFVVPDTPESGDYARIQVNRLCRDHAERHSVGSWKTEVKEHRSGGLSDEYRTWVDSENPNVDKFVWVVRRTEFRK